MTKMWENQKGIQVWAPLSLYSSEAGPSSRAVAEC